MTNNNQITFNESKNVQYVFIKYKNMDFTVNINNNAETLADIFDTPIIESSQQYKTEFHTVDGNLLFIHVYQFDNYKNNTFNQFGKSIGIKIINMDSIADIEVLEN